MPEKTRQIVSERDRSENPDSGDFKEIILTLKESLSERFNYLFRLIYEEGLDSSEISEITNMNLKEVQKLKSQMIKNIRRIVKEKRLYPEKKLSLSDTPGVQ